MRPVKVSTFGHFLAQRAGTGERGGRKGAAQGAGARLAAARLLGLSAPKCPKVAITSARMGLDAGNQRYPEKGQGGAVRKYLDRALF